MGCADQGFRMTGPLPRPSISPLPSYASRPFASRPVTIVEALRQIVAWWRGDKPTFKHQIAEAKLIERLAEELAEEETPPTPAPRQPKRSLRASTDRSSG